MPVTFSDLAQETEVIIYFSLFLLPNAKFRKKLPILVKIFF